MNSLCALQKKWDRAAPWYDLVVAPLEFFFFRRLRAGLLRMAAGQVLEVGVGTGVNLRHYAPGVDIVAVDLSLEMAARVSARGGPRVAVAVMDAQQLAFSDATFDTVVSTLGTCTFPDPVRALCEMRRVCRPGGQILLLEHGRSQRPGVAAWQDRHAARHASYLGCWWNREPLEHVRRAGLRVRSSERAFLGIVHVIQIDN